MAQMDRLFALSPSKIGVSYLAFGGLWILLSDRLVLALARTPGAAARLQTVKGWAFVLLSAVLIVGLTRTREQQLDTSQQRLLRASQELQVLHRIFRHNIRNDLNVIQGYAELVRSKLDEAGPAADLRTISRTADRIVRMSNKLRVIERTEFDVTHDTTVDVAALVRDERDRLLDRHPGVTVDVDGPAEAEVVGDQSLAYVVRELLENAVEHRADGTDAPHIAVDVDSALTDVTVRVTDDGPGIPEGELEAISRGRESPLEHGSGIGLWLVTWLTRLYDGRVEFEATGDGTVATVYFNPASPLEQLANQSPIGAVASA